MNLLEKIYYIGYLIKKNQSLKSQKRLPYPVISIGNITVGGTGKTPLTISLSEEAKKRGFCPIILTRGYKGKAKGPCLVDITEDSHNLSSIYGDEPVLMAEFLKDVPIVKCANRYKGGLYVINSNILTSKPKPIFILDDGFQHWKLYRDLDIVLIDCINPFGNYKLFPLGILREPLSELNRADIILFTKAFKGNEKISNNLNDLSKKIGVFTKAPLFYSEYKISGLLDSAGNRLPIESLKDKKIYAFCAIGNPESFLHLLKSLTNKIIKIKTYRDHYSYTHKDILYLIRECKKNSCDYLVTTEKDRIKIKNFDLPANLLSIQIAFDVSQDFFDYIFEKINNYHHHGG